MKHLKKFNYTLFESKKNKETIKSEIEDYFLNLIDMGTHKSSLLEDYHIYVSSEKGLKKQVYDNLTFSQNKNVPNEFYLTDKQFNKLNQLQDGYYPLYQFTLSVDKFFPMQSILKVFERLDSDDDIFIFDIVIETSHEMTSNHEFRGETKLGFFVAELTERVDGWEDLPKEFKNGVYGEESSEEEDDDWEDD